MHWRKELVQEQVALAVPVRGQRAVSADPAGPGTLQRQAARRPMAAALQFCQGAALVRVDLSVRVAALRPEAATLARRTQAEQQVFPAGQALPQSQQAATKTWWPPAHEFGSPLCVRRQQHRSASGQSGITYQAVAAPTFRYCPPSLHIGVSPETRQAWTAARWG